MWNGWERYTEERRQRYVRGKGQEEKWQIVKSGWTHDRVGKE
jgi:hypothetical protein